MIAETSSQAPAPHSTNMTAVDTMLLECRVIMFIILANRIRSTERTASGRLKLPTGETERDYVRTYCADHLGWRRCTVARAITRFYEAQDED